MRGAPRGLAVDVPGRRRLLLRHLALDLNGTLARDGRLLPGVRPRLRRLGRLVEVTVLTADTFGTARSLFAGLPVGLETVRTGADKRRFVSARRGVAAVGNGANDLPMMGAADLGIAVVGSEGMAAALARAADVVVVRIEDALDLLLHPRRLAATLRR